MVGLALEASRPAVDIHAPIKAIGIPDCLGAGYRQVVAVKVHIAGHVQVQQPVAVVVSPGRSGRPVAKRHAGCFRLVCEGPVVVVVVEPVLPVVAHIDVRPAVVVVVGNRAAITPAVVLHARLGAHVGKGAILVVPKQRRVRRLFLAVQRVECRAVHQVDRQPAAVVVIDQADARSVGLNDELLFRHAHLVNPAGEPRGFGDVLEDHRSGIHKAARGDGPLMFVVDRGSSDAPGNPAHALLRLSLLGRRLASGFIAHNRSGDQHTGSGTNPAFAASLLRLPRPAIAGNR